MPHFLHVKYMKNVKWRITVLHLIVFFIDFLFFPWTCLAITCGHPGNPANGRTNGSEFNLNDVVNFTCNKGYILSGNARAQCRLNGQWSNPLPVCKGHIYHTALPSCLHTKICFLFIPFTN